MKVYIVLGIMDYDVPDILGVYTCKECAEDADDHRHEYDDFRIEEHKVIEEIDNG